MICFPKSVAGCRFWSGAQQLYRPRYPAGISCTRSNLKLSPIPIRSSRIGRLHALRLDNWRSFRCAQKCNERLRCFHLANSTHDRSRKTMVAQKQTLKINHLAGATLRGLTPLPGPLPGHRSDSAAGRRWSHVFQDVPVDRGEQPLLLRSVPIGERGVLNLECKSLVGRVD